ncbi:hypothetical protein [Nocardia tengchongensis]|uniref:hypothetical protein n=1 Tax=Nocardia tengchongensis TaxID=2055889 RepID=UPI003695C1D9
MLPAGCFGRFALWSEAAVLSEGRCSRRPIYLRMQRAQWIAQLDAARKRKSKAARRRGDSCFASRQSVAVAGLQCVASVLVIGTVRMATSSGVGIAVRTVGGNSKTVGRWDVSRSEADTAGAVSCSFTAVELFA